MSPLVSKGYDGDVHKLLKDIAWNQEENGEKIVIAIWNNYSILSLEERIELAVLCKRTWYAENYECKISVDKW